MAGKSRSRTWILDCSKCGAPAGEPCVSLDRRRKRQQKVHAERRAAVARFVREAYCQNESQSGYGCGVEGCPHCGGEAVVVVPGK